MAGPAAGPLLHVPAVREAEYVVFGGGGARGLAYVGWAQAVADLCSVDFGARTGGALFALLVALGFSASDLDAALAALAPTHLARVTPSTLARADAHAADDGTALQATLAGFLYAKTGAADMTLAELEARTSVRFVAVAVDRATCAVRYLSADTAPSMSVVKAVYASMALPLLYPPLRTAGGAELFDGGCMDNLPLGVFPAARTLAVGLHWGQDGPSAAAAPHAAPAGTSAGTSAASSVAAYLARAVYCTTYVPSVVAWAAATSEQRWRTMLLDVRGVPTVELELGTAFKEGVKGAGYAAASAALHRMATRQFPQPPTRGFGWACPEALPHYARKLVNAAAEADAAWLRTVQQQQQQQQQQADATDGNQPG